MRRSLAGVISFALGIGGVFTFGGSPASAAQDVSRAITPNAAPVTTTTSVAGANIRVRFQGLAGQVVGVATSAGTFAGNCDAHLSLLGPDGATVAGPVCGGQAGAIGSVTLQSDGTYQAFVDPSGALVGTVEVAVPSTGAIQSVTPNAPFLSLSVPAEGSVDLGFPGTTGKYVAVKAIGPGTCTRTYRVVKPDTTDLFGTKCAEAGSGSFTDQVTLPVTGVYQLRLANSLRSTVVMKVQIWVNTDRADTLALDGPAITTADLAVAQDEALTFSGAIGATVAVGLSGSTLASYCVDLERPDRSSATRRCLGTGPGFLPEFTLDAAGTWTILIDPQATHTGHVSVQVGTGASASTLIAASEYHSCAVVADGAVRCWGYNVAGELGDGPTTTVWPRSRLSESRAPPPWPPATCTRVRSWLEGQPGAGAPMPLGSSETAPTPTAPSP